MAHIHRTALVEDGAQLADDVEIGPYAVIDKNVSIGPGTRVGSHVRITGHTTIGKNNRIFHSVAIGEDPQDLSFNNLDGRVVMGDNNQIREFCTIHLPTKKEKNTEIGSNCLLMVNTHIAHDCFIGDHVIIANNTMVAGHVTIEKYAFVSGAVALHQFVKIGESAMLGGMSRVAQDVPPFVLANGIPPEIHGLNVVGLKRRDFKPPLRKALKAAFKAFYVDTQNTTKGLQNLKDEVLSQYDSGSEEYQRVAQFIDFIEKSERGITR